MSGIQNATNRSIKPFKSSEEYLYAMKEDLAEWLRDLYDVDIAVNNFTEVLETGALLCHHANKVTSAAEAFLRQYGRSAHTVHLPTAGVTFVSSAQPATFPARDNVSNFISWCRKEMGIKDVLMFETEDLVMRKNEKNFVLCLLEVARRASRFGMAAPVLIQLEQEIEEEIREDMALPSEQPPVPRVQRQLSSFKNLDEMVQHLVSSCTCPSQFPMIKVSEGKYRVGDSSTLIFVRILRNHVMVRVGGGWDTLQHYLDKHDPCRCSSLMHKQTKLPGYQRPAAPVHEVTALPPPRQNGRGGDEPMLLVSRAQASPPARRSPAPSHAPAPTRVPRPSSVGSLPRRLSPSPDLGARAARELRPPTPDRMMRQSATPTPSSLSSEIKKPACISSNRMGREVTRQSTPPPRLVSSLPRPVHASPSCPEPRRPCTPLVFHKTPGHLSLHLEHSAERWQAQTWSKSQFRGHSNASCVQNTELDNKAPNPITVPRQAVLFKVSQSSPVRSYIPINSSHFNARQTCRGSQQASDTHHPPQASDFIRTFSPTTQMRLDTSGEPPLIVLTPPERDPKQGVEDLTAEKKLKNSHSIETTPANSLANEGTALAAIQVSSSSAKNASCYSITQNNVHVRVQEPDRKIGKKYCFTAPSISPAEEASMYHSLEHEILSNLQLLDTNSDDDSSVDGGQDTDDEMKVPSSFDRNYTIPHPATSSGPSPCANQEADAGCVSNGNTYDAVIVELHERKKELDRANMESGMTTLPDGADEVSADEPRASKTSTMDSWSSLGSEPMQSHEEAHEFNTTQLRTSAYDIHSIAQSTVPSQSPSTATTPSPKQRRALRKPERVPSIYKLKLRSRVRPRRDHRPEKKPSRIPTPLSYRRDQPSRSSQRAKKQANSAASQCCSEENKDAKDFLMPSLQSDAVMVRLRETKKATDQTPQSKECESFV